MRSKRDIVNTFSFGTEFLNGGRKAKDERKFLAKTTNQILKNPSEFFFNKSVSDFYTSGNTLTFTSPLIGISGKKEKVIATLYPAKNATKAILVIPHWLSDGDSYAGICRFLQKHGFYTVKVDLPHHGRRENDAIKKEEIVSANIGRTIHAVRQTVIEARSIIDWLEQNGINDIGVLGGSLGSCISYLLTVSDKRVRASAYVELAGYFGEVIMKGEATRFIKEELEKRFSVDEVKDFWKIISPACYTKHLTGRASKQIVFSAEYDTIFPPETTEEIYKAHRKYTVPIERINVPCGHYTIAYFPFGIYVGSKILGFFRRNL